MVAAPRRAVSTADVDEAVRELAAAQFDVSRDRIDLDMPIADAPDSLGLSILVAALEQRFDVALADREVAKARTLRDLGRLVAARRNGPPST